MFPTVSVHLQEPSFYKLYVVFGICGYDIQLIKVAPDDGLIQSETRRACIEK